MSAAATLLLAAALATPAWGLKPIPPSPFPTPSPIPTPTPTPTPSPTPSPGPTDPGEEPPYTEQTLQQGEGWRLVESNGYAVDDGGHYYNARQYMIRDAAGVQNAPLSAGLRQDLLRNLDTEGNAFTISQPIADAIAASELSGTLSPELLALAEPQDGPGDPLPRDGFEAQRLFGRCDDRVINRSKTFNVNSPMNQNFNLGGGFSGNIDLAGTAHGTGTGEIQIRLKRYAIFAVCIPYGVRLDHARAFGNFSANYGATLSGTVNYAHNWEWPIAKPALFYYGFAIGPIWVQGGFNLPITAGLELNANVTGSVTYSGSASVAGYFDYRCTLDGCTGYSAMNTAGQQNQQPLTASISGRIKPSVYAQVAVRGYLYSESFAYAQVGLRPYLHGDLWGYYGNNCGDAEGDGYFETVDALTFDLDWQVFVTAQADTFLTNEKRWTLLDLFGRRHLKFWDLIGSSALRPQLLGPSSVPVNTSQLYNLKMRPCWPYTDNVDYRMAWGDGLTNSYNASPATWVQASHTWTTLGTKALQGTAVRDAHGRVFEATTARSVEVTAGGTATHLGMTWRVLGQSGAYVHVGADGVTDAYNGDTNVNTSLPVLCLLQDGRSAPTTISFDFYNGWALGEVRLTAPVMGSALTSRAVADGICSGTFGPGYRMGEFHDGAGGWSWWAQGVLNATSRFWVAINDQPANPWD